MTFLQFARHNVLRDLETYLGFWLSSVFTVAIFFVFSVNAYHPELDMEGSSTKLMMGMARILIVIFAVLFLSLSIYSFVERRRHSFGALLMMGMSRRQLRRLLLAENVLVGSGAIACGVVVGLVFGQLSVMVMAKILRVRDVSWVFPAKAIRDTLICFAPVFVLVTLVLARGLSRRSILELLSAKQDESRDVSFSTPLAILGALLLLGGYGLTFYSRYRSLVPTPIDDLMQKGLPELILLCVIVGSLLFVSQFVFLFLSRVKAHPRYLEGDTALWVSGVMQKLKSSVAAMFASTLLLSGAFCALVATVALALSTPADIEAQYPFAAYYYSYGDNPREADELAVIEGELERQQVPYERTMLSFALFGDPLEDAVAPKAIALSEYRSLTGEDVWLEDGEALDISGSDAAVGTTIELGGTSFVMAGAGTRILNSPQDAFSYVVSDASFAQIAREATEKHAYLYSYDDMGGLVQESLAAVQATRDELGIGIRDGDSFLYVPRAEALYLDEWSNQLLAYLGVMFSAVFIVASASLIYFRLVSSVREGLPTIRNLNRLGMSQGQLQRVQQRQLLVLFVLPVALAVINTGFAMNFLVVNGLASTALYWRFAMMIVPLLLLQAGYFAVLNRQFQTKVRSFLRVE